MMIRNYFILLAILNLVLISVAHTFKGCYKDNPSAQTFNVPQRLNVDQCVDECKNKYYKYSLIKFENRCLCTNYIGEEIDTRTCQDTDPSFGNLYATGNLVPGPPSEVSFFDIRDTSVSLSWKAPESYTDILYYSIKAIVNHTFASYVPNSPEYKYPNDTFRTTLLTLPATKYSIAIRAVSQDGLGAPVTQTVETKLGDLENIPEPPKIIKNYGSKIEIKISEVTNNNGPISSYLVVVVNNRQGQFFQEQLLKSFDEAKKDDTTYYITAELNPSDIFRNFIVGDGRYYGRYYNAPLDASNSYNVIVGVVSRFKGDTKQAFSTVENSSKMLNIVPMEDVNGDSPAVIIGLSIAIGLLSCLLIAGIIGFFILKSRVTNRRHRLSDNQELTLQGPMIEVENNGYIPEEEHTKANHYKNLKQKLRSIPYNQLKIEPTSLLGIGRFGRVNNGSLYENNTLIPIAVYSIHDKKLSHEDKKNMLLDLDVLLKSGKHDNIISLIGTCETPQLLLVALEYVSMNLKDLLLGSRDSLPGRFSNMSEMQALEIAIDVCRGMAHLESSKIVHKQLCARNILIANGFVPKISGYGLAQYYSHNNLPDYTRWTALEVFKGQPANCKSDVWSFACLLWEICVLGGTPYGNFSNNEIPEQILKGLRLPQMKYFNDDLYQIMLNCWQIDMDERPNFIQLIELLDALKNNNLIPYLSFNLYSNFQYEQFYPDMEIAVRPVF